MRDLHSHILPFIDDGADDFETALAMLKIASDDGITDMCVTPHFIPGQINNTAELVKKELEIFKQLAVSKGYNINLYPGNEVFISPEVPKLLKEGSICTINDSRYVLVELPGTLIPTYTEEVLYEIRLMGYVPIIAHPERNAQIGKNPEILLEWIRQGAFAQVNSGSLTGTFGKQIQQIALQLIKKGAAHYVSSDCHSCRTRSPKLTKARELIRKKFDDSATELLFEKNALSILNNKEPEEILAYKPERKNWFYMQIQLARTVFSQ